VTRNLRPRPASATVEIWVQPGASRQRVVGMHGDAVKVAVAAPPEKGAANRALEKLLAETFGLSAGAVAVSAGGGILVVAGQVTSDSYGLYLVDTKSTTMAVYQWVPRTGKLRLMAARYYGFDLQLNDYNNEKETSPSEIQGLVKQQRPIGAATQPN
jgi:uncharacterized protein (TIGR00251 family)